MSDMYFNIITTDTTFALRSNSRKTTSNMKYKIILLLFLIGFAKLSAQKVPQVYIDNLGVMRWDNTHKEASFYGVNYTLPFAHAYRVMNNLDINHKDAIDRDVYHITRLGVNAYRIHIWDVEVSDESGNLINNHHMDLLDYLIAQLQKRNIYVLITAQTNFGNGYPEKNIPTGGFAYLYDKCDIHANPDAIKAQRQYLNDLVKHINPYTGLAYKDDPYVVGFEINNEPCHAGDEAQVKSYINTMFDALSTAGNTKPVFYNVSHNQHVVSSYFETAVQGTTYQWYPLGLVNGKTRSGNFLPYVDDYCIPFKDVKEFDKKARLVYEFDPADNLYTYLFPATARTFRKAGFQWITQFSYDPIDMANANTEYQTHYLNLVYTPGKAIGMKIAAEVTQQMKRGHDYGVYPADTLFGDFRVSHNEDLSELNSPTKFFYSNTTKTQPKASHKLEAIAGYGESPLVRYEGTGAYFIDKLEKGVWRLEVLPDALVVNDPFAKPSLEKEVVRIIYGNWDMSLNIPDLGGEFFVNGLNAGNSRNTTTKNGVIESLQPGVYILQRTTAKPKNEWHAGLKWNNILLGEYVQTKTSDATHYSIAHIAKPIAENNQSLIVEATIVGSELPDSVFIYTDKVSFWNLNNPSYKMKRVSGYKYRGEIPMTELQGEEIKYNIIVAHNKTMQTFPSNEDMHMLSLGYAQGILGNPLDWNYTHSGFWTTQLCNFEQPLMIFNASDSQNRMETYCIPKWLPVSQRVELSNITHGAVYRVSFEDNNDNNLFMLRKHIRDRIIARSTKAKNATSLFIRFTAIPNNLKIGFTTTDGLTYLSDYAIVKSDVCNAMVVEVPLKKMIQTKTALMPYAYPDFLSQWFESNQEVAFVNNKIEMFELYTNSPEIGIESIWLN